MAPLATQQDHSPEQKRIHALVCSRWDAAEKLHRQYTPKWDQFYGLSRNWRRLKKSLTAAVPNDKDVVLQELKREWGQELFVPYCFTVIETVLPRILSKDPTYRALPGDLEEATHAALEPLEQLYARDAAAMSYTRKLQETARSGLRYGLGVQKDYWECKTRKGKRIEPYFLKFGKKVVDGTITVYEGPQVESVDIYDFRWDPSAHDLESAAFVIHRTWRSFEYIQDRVEEGKRKRAEGKPGGWVELDLEAIKKLGSTTGRGSAWSGRYEASGISNPGTDGSEGSKEFEVWEYHDRDKVVQILGGSAGIVVQEDENPFLHGDFPFTIYRPTLVEHEFVGIGEIEPIAHLQWELNTLRGQRRDAATLALNQGYFYQEGSLDPSQIVLGPGMLNSTWGNPQEILQPMNFRDIPQSGISEEEAIKSDIEMATGISEATIGSAGEENATNTQLVQAAANLRIKQKAKNLYVDLLRPEIAHRQGLYEQYVVSEQQTQTVRVNDATKPTGYRFIQVTPEMFQANVEIVPVDGSTEADDPAQKKHDASELAAAIAPFADKVNPEEVLKHILEQHDVEAPERWIKHGPSPEEASSQTAQSVAEHFTQAMEQAGIPPHQIQQAMEQAHQSLSQELESKGQGEAPEPESNASSNGAAPEPIGAP